MIVTNLEDIDIGEPHNKKIKTYNKSILIMNIF